MSEWFEIIISYAEQEFSPPVCEATVIFVPAWILKTEKSLCRGISEQMILWKYGNMVFTFLDETERSIAANAKIAWNVFFAEGIQRIHGTLREMSLCFATGISSFDICVYSNVSVFSHTLTMV